MFILQRNIFFERHNQGNETNYTAFFTQVKLFLHFTQVNALDQCPIKFLFLGIQIAMKLLQLKAQEGVNTQNRAAIKNALALGGDDSGPLAGVRLISIVTDSQTAFKSRSNSASLNLC